MAGRVPRDLTFRGPLASRVILCVAAAALLAIGTASRAQAPGGAAPSAESRLAALEAALKSYERRLQRLDDIEAINKLQRAYGYYVDKGQWTQVVDLFADQSSVEIAARGVYLGKKGAERLFLHAFGGGKDGLAHGRLFNHFMLQGIVDVEPGAQTAKGRWRAFVQVAQYQQSATWSEGIYENEYVNEDGVWKFSKMRFWPTYYTPFDAGWAVRNLPNNGPNQQFPPDQPSTDDAPVFPDIFVPPYHYRNPVTGR